MSKTQPIDGGGSEYREKPHRDLDLYDKAVDPSLTDEFLDKNSLGLGNLTEAEVYQLVDEFRMGSYGDAAFSDLLDDRRVYETKRKLALNGFSEVNEDGSSTELSGWEDKDESRRAEKDRRRYIEQRGAEIWNALEDDQQYRAIIEHTGVPDWMAPQLRNVLLRVELSKSKGARTQDNLFGRVKKYIDEGNNSGGSSARERLRRLTGGGRGGGNR